MPDTATASLPLDRASLESAALRAIECSRAKGASDAEAEASASVGQSVTVRLGEVEGKATDQKGSKPTGPQAGGARD